MKLRKKNWLFRLILASIVCLILSGCSNAAGDPVDTPPATQATIEAGKLKVGVHMGYIPMEYYGEDGKPAGFDMELAGLLAEELGLELEIVPGAWDAIFKNLEEGSYDLIISCVSYTKEREARYSLSNPYLNNGLVLVVPGDSTVQDFSQMDGGEVGVQLDTTADDYVKSLIAEGEKVGLAQYENVSNAFDAMERGEVQAVLSDSVVANDFLMRHDDCRIVWESEEKEPICICMGKENVRLRVDVSNALQHLTEKGTVRELSLKYFGVDITAAAE